MKPRFIGGIKKKKRTKMTNEEVMTLMTDMGLHEGGMENWVPDNAWFLFANKVQEKEREECAKLMDEMAVKDNLTNRYRVAANAIRARGQE
jgi:hypothetical protein